jgi:hypothetical protein
MSRSTRFISCVLLTVGATVLFQQTSTAQPSGTISTNITSSTNLVWDLGGLFTRVSFAVTNHADGATVRVSYPVVLNQSGGGRLTGGSPNPAVTLTADGYNIRFSGGKYSLTGSVTSHKGLGHLLLKAQLTGSATLTGHKVKASHLINVRFDNQTMAFTGKQTDSAYASTRGTISQKSDIAGSVSSIFSGDGTWTLTLNDLTTTGKKVVGSATVLLNSGQSFHYNVHGTFTASTGISKLVLVSAEKATNGSTLRVSLNGDAITAIKGSISGQAVKLTL